MTAPHLTGTVVQSGRIAVDEESIYGLLIEIDPAALRDYPQINALAARAKSPAISIALRHQRDKLAEVFEDLGSIMGLLREAICDAEAGNLPGAKMVAEDAIDLLSQQEVRFSEITSSLTRWIYSEPQPKP
jgi:hypothetical protein